MSKDKRSGVFDDLSDFKPAAKPRSRPDPAAVAKAAEASGFVNRDPQPAPEPAKPVRAQRRRRTGRTAQLSIKLRPETIQQFYDYCDGNELTLGEGFERALAALEAHR